MADFFGLSRDKYRQASPVLQRAFANLNSISNWSLPENDARIALCKEIGNELEVARSYQAFAEFVLGEQGYRHNPEIVREARTLGQMATEIFERQRITLSSTPLALNDWLTGELLSQPGPTG